MTIQDLVKDDGESKAERTPYLRLYTDDWLAGTRALSFEEKGFYLELLCMMWARKNGLPNDVDELARHLKTDRRKVRRLLDALLGDPHKLKIVDDQLVNPRIEKEIATHRRQAKSARSRGKVKAKSRRSLGDFASKSSAVGAPPIAKSAGYAPTGFCPESRVQSPEPEKRDPKPASVESKADGVLAGLNGSAYPMLEDIQLWMTPPTTEVHARRWLASQIAIFGENATKDGYAKLKTDLATGTTIARPLQYWASVARSMRDKPPDRVAKPLFQSYRERRHAENVEFARMVGLEVG